MKEFMFIFIGKDYADLGLSPEEQQKQMQLWFSWVDKLKAADIYVEGRALTAAARTLHDRSSLPTDGPYAEAKELVGGYFIVKSESLEAATEIAKDFPDFDLEGVVEVREVMVH